LNFNGSVYSIEEGWDIVFVTLAEEYREILGESVQCSSFEEGTFGGQ
jgi:hypothetical protein